MEGWFLPFRFTAVVIIGYGIIYLVLIWWNKTTPALIPILLSAIFIAIYDVMRFVTRQVQSPIQIHVLSRGQIEIISINRDAGEQRFVFSKSKVCFVQQSIGGVAEIHLTDRSIIRGTVTGPEQLERMIEIL